ncbi:hypothetical protein OMP43_07270 [Sphingomonas sp. CBMAI 2297]|uniref:hypothetical protein n=1 Tax=Sphingomonas sp. CBMAI 2297 TaxID=2991720 RepID=UPI0024555F11|nr:hypothetical protein [Sphingomonas sp. CBMAI 2297]MDH4743814.1 hypothetical protein [Sphingomonas sp. CBMAI 2297]
MKDWFPFTSYDFYAYLTAGMVTLAAVDRAFFDSMLASQASWTVVNGAFWTAISYLIGQILAIPSSTLLEHLLARKWLRSPSRILLGLDAPRWREICVRWAFGAREYEPLPTATRNSVLRKIAAALSVPVANVDGEVAFHCAFPHARSVSDSATRLDNFMNQYGMCRNVSFASTIAAVLMTWRAAHTCDRLDWSLAIAAMILAIGLFGRFVKFYAAYGREVFRTYDKVVSLPPAPVAP